MTSSDPGDPDDPGATGEISFASGINALRRSPSIKFRDLYSSNKMQSREYPDRPSEDFPLGTPIETAVSDRSNVVQDLMAVVAAGKDVAIGVVKGKDTSGGEVNYLSLMSSNPSGSEGRAKFIDILAEGVPVTIGRAELEQVVGREESVPGVSGTHCTIELKDGVLTVIDENSTNGTSVFTNKTESRARQFGSIKEWCQPSEETAKLIEAVDEDPAELAESDLETISHLADLAYGGEDYEEVIRQLAMLPEGSGVELMFMLSSRFAEGDPTPMIIAGGILERARKTILSISNPGNQ